VPIDSAWMDDRDEDQECRKKEALRDPVEVWMVSGLEAVDYRVV
jgi:hypothetical protein